MLHLHYFQYRLHIQESVFARWYSNVSMYKVQTSSIHSDIKLHFRCHQRWIPSATRSLNFSWKLRIPPCRVLHAQWIGPQLYHCAIHFKNSWLTASLVALTGAEERTMSSCHHELGLTPNAIPHFFSTSPRTIRRAAAFDFIQAELCCSDRSDKCIWVNAHLSGIQTSWWCWSLIRTGVNFWNHPLCHLIVIFTKYKNIYSVTVLEMNM